MAGINISEVKTVAVKDSDDLEIRPGDQIMIRNNRGEDIVCRFKDVAGGYSMESHTERTCKKWVRTN